MNDTAKPTGHNAIPRECPHGVQYRSYAFDASAMYQTRVKQFIAATADGCPGCMEQRIADLRGACNALMGVAAGAMRFVPTSEIAHGLRRDWEEASDLYRKDLRDWYGPRATRHEPKKDDR